MFLSVMTVFEKFSIFFKNISSKALSDVQILLEGQNVPDMT